MHWFDRISQRVAEAETVEAPVGATTRRSALKGATLAATLALPFVPEAVSTARAAGGVAPNGTLAGGTLELPDERQPLESTSEFCHNCLDRAYGDHNQKLQKCGPAPSSRPLLKPKGAPKAPSRKASPASGAKRLACQAKVMKSLNKNLEGCRLHFCEADSEPPAPPAAGGGVGAEASFPTCPPGTSLCSQTLCCYGNDVCCVCASTGGFICCVSEVGCTCC